MVTLSTALVFSLVVFPALCYIVDLKDAETGSVSALVTGRWREFLGLPPRDGGFSALHSADADLETAVAPRCVTDAGEGGLASSMDQTPMKQSTGPHNGIAQDLQ